MRAFIGIDPGLHGGLAYINPYTGKTIATPMPLIGKTLDMPKLVDWFANYIADDPVVCIERVICMPGQGLVSTGKFFFVTGVVWGIIAACRYSMFEVRSQDWKKVILEGTLKDKQAAIDYCTRMYPSVSLMATARSKKPSDGMADALCIATFAMIKYRNSGGV